MGDMGYFRGCPGHGCNWVCVAYLDGPQKLAEQVADLRYDWHRIWCRKRPFNGRIEYRLFGLFSVAVMESVVKPKEGMRCWVRPFITWKWLDD